MMHRQRGATLVVVLVMLVVLTLFAVSAINLTNMNMKIVSNMQQRSYAESMAQTAVETVLNSSTAFYSPTSAVTVSAPTGMTISVGTRTCTASEAATGYSAAQSIVPEDTYWNIPVTVTDTVTSASVAMHQGVKMRMLSGNCPS
jgi:Tfp pilus assembly protein PilX